MSAPIIVTISCPACGKARELRVRDLKSASHIGNLCRPCGNKRAWENPSQQRLASIATLSAAGCESRRGVPLSEDHKARLRERRKGRTPYNKGRIWTAEQRANLSARRTGKPCSQHRKEAIRIAQHRRYGTAPNRAKPTRRELGQWAHEVIRRDGAMCVICGHKKRGRADIAAHHILSRGKHPGLALLINNGVTLCVPCHASEHSINGRL